MGQMSGNIVDIPLNQVFDDPKEGGLRPVQSTSMGYDIIKQTMSIYGQWHPIQVRAAEDKPGSYYVVDGHQRVGAAKELGLPNIRAEVVDISDDEVPVRQIISNLAVVQTKPAQYARTLQRVLALPKYMGMGKSQLMHVLGLNKSVSWLDDQLRLNKLIEPIQKLVDQDKISPTKATWLAKLSEEDQLDFVDDAERDPAPLFIQKVQARLQELKAAQKGLTTENVDPLKNAKSRSLTEHKTKYQSLESQLLNVKNEETRLMLVGQLAYAQWSLSIDEESLAAKKAEQDKKKAEQAARVAARREVMKKISSEIKNLTPDQIKEVHIES